MKKILIIIILFFLNVSISQVNDKKFIVASTITYKNKLSTYIRNNWQHLDIAIDTIPGTSSDRAYSELINRKKGKKIIVAVIDNYMDIYHEDIKDAIWINKKEIPNNGLDDDQNGYVDDVHGWNFLGNKNGKDLEYANTESSRIVEYIKNQYSTKKSPINPRDSIELFTATKKHQESKSFLLDLQKYNQENLNNYRESLLHLDKEYQNKDFDLEDYDKLYQKSESDVTKKNAIWFIRNIRRLGKNLDILKLDSLKLQEELQLTYQPNYYDRNILGDNETDLKDINYGSNNIWSKSKKHYHGTIVAGILGARRNNNIGINGFSNQILIMPIKTTPNGGSENDKDVALGIRYAVDNGAKIINLSFGKTSSLHPEWIKEALIYAEQHDVLVVAGAGNNASNNDINPFYPIDYDVPTGAEYCNNFIKVGANTLDGNKYLLLPSTNYGKKTVDIFAPGYFLKTTDPVVGYSYRDGTSMASPIVAGVAALVRSYYPKLSAADVKQILLDSSVKYDLEVQVPGEKEGTLKNFQELSKSGGVVNAYNALLMAKHWKKR